MQDYIQNIRGIIQSVERSSAPIPHAEVLTGYSSAFNIHTIGKLCQLYGEVPNGCYVEVGVFQGMTLLSAAAANPHLPCYGIDNFAFFDPEKNNQALIEERRQRLSLENAHLINADYEDALEGLGGHIGQQKVCVYLVDGPHDYRSQLMCLLLALPWLHERAVILIDDCNYEHVRQANRDFLVAHSGFKLLFEHYTTIHPANKPNPTTEGWWNGINIIVRDPDGVLPPMYPPTNRNRTVFENDHLVHAARGRYLAPEAVYLANKILSFSPKGISIGLRKLFARAKEHPLREAFDFMNTFSAGHKGSRYNGTDEKAKD